MAKRSLKRNAAASRRARSQSQPSRSEDDSLRQVRRLVREELERVAAKFPAQSFNQLRSDLKLLEQRVERLAIATGKKKGPRRQGPGRPVVHEGCTVLRCGEAHYARGLCSAHYQQRRRARQLG